uniref:Uncharacterized protein n=1 Tax=Anguilla anguilla TaxID=7936 RepID=A0A0E9ULR6_ANGAN
MRWYEWTMKSKRPRTVGPHSLCALYL